MKRFSPSDASRRLSAQPDRSFGLKPKVVAFSTCAFPAMGTSTVEPARTTTVRPASDSARRRSTRRTEFPTWIVVPSASAALVLSLRPFRIVPALEPTSTIDGGAPPFTTTVAWWRETLGSSRRIVLSGARPMVTVSAIGTRVPSRRTSSSGSSPPRPFMRAPHVEQ